MNSVKHTLKKYSFWENIFPLFLSLFLVIMTIWVIFVSLHAQPLHTPSDEDTTTNSQTLEGGDNS